MPWTFTPPLPSNVSAPEEVVKLEAAAASIETPDVVSKAKLAESISIAALAFEISMSLVPSPVRAKAPPSAVMPIVVPPNVSPASESMPTAPVASISNVLEAVKVLSASVPYTPSKSGFPELSPVNVSVAVQT